MNLKTHYRKRCIPTAVQYTLLETTMVPPRGVTGLVRIVDFDQSVRGDKPNSGCIQAEIYRSPEVVLDAGYSYSADIWSLGVMVCY